MLDGEPFGTARAPLRFAGVVQVLENVAESTAVLCVHTKLLWPPVAPEYSLMPSCSGAHLAGLHPSPPGPGLT